MNLFDHFLISSTIYSLNIVVMSILLSVVSVMLILFIKNYFPLIFKIKQVLFKIILCVPATALMLLFIFWFGNADVLKILFLSIVTIAYIINNEQESILKTDVHMLTLLGWSKHKIFFNYLCKIYFSKILYSLNQISILMWTYLVIMESIQSSIGLGYLINSALNRGNMETFMMAMIIITAMSYIINQLILIIKKHFDKKWKLCKC